MSLIKKHIRGDTLIEVLFATTVFSLIAVGGISVMNQGLSAAQRSLEITLVRNEMDAQAEMLRFLNSSYVSMYQPGAIYPGGTPANRWSASRLSLLSNETPASNLTVGNACPAFAALRANSFILNTKNGTFVPLNVSNYRLADTYARVNYNASNLFTNSGGIWIEAVRSNASTDPNQINVRFIDFHIRACWDSPGQKVPSTLGTIVRLYEPL